MSIECIAACLVIAWGLLSLAAFLIVWLYRADMSRRTPHKGDRK